MRRDNAFGVIGVDAAVPDVFGVDSDDRPFATAAETRASGDAGVTLLGIAGCLPEALKNSRRAVGRTGLVGTDRDVFFGGVVGVWLVVDIAAIGVGLARNIARAPPVSSS